MKCLVTVIFFWDNRFYILKKSEWHVYLFQPSSLLILNGMFVHSEYKEEWKKILYYSVWQKNRELNSVSKIFQQKFDVMSWKKIWEKDQIIYPFNWVISML